MEGRILEAPPAIVLNGTCGDDEEEEEEEEAEDADDSTGGSGAPLLAIFVHREIWISLGVGIQVGINRRLYYKIGEYLKFTRNTGFVF